MSRRPHPEARRLLADIYAYCERTGINRTRFGLLVANDGNLLSRLEAGRQPRLDTIDSIRNFIRKQKR